MHNDARKTIINHHLYLNSKTSCDTSLARLTVAQLWLQCDPVNLLKTKGFRSTCFKGWVIPKCQGEHWCTTYIWTAPSKEAPGILFCIINSHFLSICQFADTFVFRDPFQCLARKTSRANCSIRRPRSRGVHEGDPDLSGDRSAIELGKRQKPWSYWVPSPPKNKGWEMVRFTSNSLILHCWEENLGHVWRSLRINPFKLSGPTGIAFSWLIWMACCRNSKHHSGSPCLTQ